MKKMHNYTCRIGLIVLFSLSMLSQLHAGDVYLTGTVIKEFMSDKTIEKSEGAIFGNDSVRINNPEYNNSS